MRIRQVDTLICDAYRCNWVFVKVTCDEGLIGWGECTLEYREQTVAQAVADLAPDLIGRDPTAIQAWWQQAYRDAYWRGGAVLTSALSGVEMALWDLLGKRLGVPVHQLFGGPVRSSVPCYANAWFTDARTPDEFARAACLAADQGFQALKWDPFGSAFRHIGPQEERAALNCVDAVHRAVDDRCILLIEGHGRFDLPAATRLAHALEDFQVGWFEEPLIPGNIAALAELRRRTRTPLAAGERLYTRWDFRELITAQAVDYIQPDVSHVGGILELRQVASLAETWQIGICPHNPMGPVANAASLQLAASIPGYRWLETMASDVPWRAAVAKEQCHFADGLMSIPDAPGLGVEINEEALAEHPYQRHELRHYRGDLTSIRPEGSQAWFARTEKNPA